METFTRRFNPAERRTLADLVVRTTEDYVWASMILVLYLSFVGAVAGWTSVFLFSVMSKTFSFPDRPELSAVPTLLALVASFLWVRRKWWASPLTRQMRSDFENGEARIHVVETAQAILVEEVEDEGQTVFVKTTDGSTLAFHDQDLSRYTKKGFPWVRFEIVEGPTSGFLLGYVGLGPPAPREAFPGPLPLAEADAYGLHTRRWGEIDVPFEEVLKRRAERSAAQR